VGALTPSFTNLGKNRIDFSILLFKLELLGEAEVNSKKAEDGESDVVRTSEVKAARGTKRKKLNFFSTSIIQDAIRTRSKSDRTNELDLALKVKKHVVDKSKTSIHLLDWGARLFCNQYATAKLHVIRNTWAEMVWTKSSRVNPYWKKMAAYTRETRSTPFSFGVFRANSITVEIKESKCI